MIGSVMTIAPSFAPSRSQEPKGTSDSVGCVLLPWHVARIKPPKRPHPRPIGARLGRKKWKWQRLNYQKVELLCLQAMILTRLLTLRWSPIREPILQPFKTFAGLRPMTPLPIGGTSGKTLACTGGTMTRLTPLPSSCGLSRNCKLPLDFFQEHGKIPPLCNK